MNYHKVRVGDLVTNCNQKTLYKTYYLPSNANLLLTCPARYYF